VATGCITLRLRACLNLQSFYASLAHLTSTPTSSLHSPNSPNPFLQVWNPSFDVAPASLITGIITERGMIPKVTQDPDSRSPISLSLLDPISLTYPTSPIVHHTGL